MRVPSLTGKTNECVNSDNWVVGGSRMSFFKLLRYKCQSDDTNLRGHSVFFFQIIYFYGFRFRKSYSIPNPFTHPIPIRKL